MKLPLDSIISERKLTEYLLTLRFEDDKSGFLALVGYNLENWQQLATDLRHVLEDNEAELLRTTEYGDMYQIKGSLAGPNGRVLKVNTIWIRLSKNSETRFVTLIPDKEARK